MKLAVPLARKHNAHLIGFHILEALVVSPRIVIHILAPAFASFNKSKAESAEAIRSLFDSYTKNEDAAMFISVWMTFLASDDA